MGFDRVSLLLGLGMLISEIGRAGQTPVDNPRGRIIELHEIILPTSPATYHALFLKLFTKVDNATRTYVLFGHISGSSVEIRCPLSPAGSYSSIDHRLANVIPL